MTVKLLVVSIAAAAVAMAQPKTFERRIEVIGTGEPTAGTMVWHQAGGGVSHNAVQFISAEVGMPGKTVKGAPYSADAVSESVQVLADGNKITRKSTSQVARDSEGRTRRHDKLGGIGPWGAANGPHEMVFINDPVAKVNWVLEVNGKTARKMPLPEISLKPGEAGHIFMRHRSEDGTREERKDIVMAAPIAHAPGKTESLGKRNVEGVIADGTRTTMTIPAGDMGNERPIEIVSERWFSPELQTIVMTRNNDPRFGETTYKLTNLVRAEPQRSLFEVPPDYQVTEMKGEVRIVQEEKKR